jgi:hypothetical protein
MVSAGAVCAASKGWLIEKPMMSNRNGRSEACDAPRAMTLPGGQR